MHHASSIMYYASCIAGRRLRFGMLTAVTNINMVEDNLQWKTSIGGRRPSMEDDLQWEDDIQWETTFCGRQPSMEDDLRWKTTFGGRRPSVEDDLWWNTTFGGRQAMVEDDPCMLPSPLCSIFEGAAFLYVGLPAYNNPLPAHIATSSRPI